MIKSFSPLIASSLLFLYLASLLASPASCGTLLTASLTGIFFKLLESKFHTTSSNFASNLGQLPHIALAYFLVLVCQYIGSILFGLPWIIQIAIDLIETIILLRYPTARDAAIDPSHQQQQLGHLNPVATVPQNK
jgi:uncharacterized membrane protein YczE